MKVSYFPVSTINTSLIDVEESDSDMQSVDLPDLGKKSVSLDIVQIPRTFMDAKCMLCRLCIIKQLSMRPLCQVCAS